MKMTDLNMNIKKIEIILLFLFDLTIIPIWISYTSSEKTVRTILWKKVGKKLVYINKN